MITVEELKLQFGVRQVPGRGPCIVIPKGKFNIEWEQALREHNIDVELNVNLAGGACTVLRLKPEHLSGERVVYSPEEPKHKQPIAWQDPERRWKPEEDELIIALWNRKQNIPEIYTELHKRFPNRTIDAVKCRVSRLIKAGKMPSRWHKREQKEPFEERRSPRAGFGPKMKHSNEVIEFARQLASQTDPAYSSRDIAKQIEKKFGVKVSNVAVSEWLISVDKSVKAIPSTSPMSTPVHTPKEPEKNEIVELLKEIRDFLKESEESVVFESYCPQCRDKRTVDDSNVWKCCPICGGPLIIWNVEGS